MSLSETVQREAERLSSLPSRVDDTDAFGAIDEVKILKMIGLNPADPRAHAVVAVARRYALDPVLGHIEVLKDSSRPYITRDGYLHIAHRSRMLDGLEVVDGPRREGSEFVCRVAVYRKDMSRPFIYPGRAAVGRDNAPEMSLARAERRALKRAFAVTVPHDFGDDDEERPPRPPNATETAESEPGRHDLPNLRAALHKATETAERSEPDPSATEPAGGGNRTIEDVPLPGDPAPAPRMISKGQQIAIHEYFRGLGITDRDKYIAEINRMIEPAHIDTTNALTADLARLVLDRLADITQAMATADDEGSTDNGTAHG